MRVLVLVLLILIAALQYRLWVGEGSLREVREIQQAVDAQTLENEKLRERNSALAAEVADLKQGLEAVEERARSELGMVKRGETFYQVMEPEALPPAAPQNGENTHD